MNKSIEQMFIDVLGIAPASQLTCALSVGSGENRRLITVHGTGDQIERVLSMIHCPKEQPVIPAWSEYGDIGNEPCDKMKIVIRGSRRSAKKRTSCDG